MINVLDIDPQNIKFDFEKAWSIFRSQDSRIRKFLTAWVLKRIHEAHSNLESCTPEELGKLQGKILELKQMEILLGLSDATEKLKEVIQFLEKNYGK